MPAWKDNACVDYLGVPMWGVHEGSVRDKEPLPEHVHGTFWSHGHIVTSMTSVLHAYRFNLVCSVVGV